MVVAVDSDLAAELVAGADEATQAEFAAYAEKVKGDTEIERLSTERPKTGVFLNRYADQPRQRRAPADLGIGLRARRLRPRRDHGRSRPRPARPRLCPRDGPARPRRSRLPRRGRQRACPTPPSPGSRPRATASSSTPAPLDGLAKAEAIDAITAQLADGRARARSRPTTACATGSSRVSATGARPSRSSTARTCGEVPVPDDQLPVTLAAHRGSGPQAQGPVAPRRGDRLGQHDVPHVRRRRAARHRHDGHVRRFVLVLPALPVAQARPTARSTSTRRRSGRPSTSTSAA